MFCFAAALAALFASPFAAAAPPDTTDNMLAATAKPAVFLTQGMRPAGCGVLLEASAAGGRYVATLALWRAEPGTALRLRVERHGASGAELPVAAARLSVPGLEAQAEFTPRADMTGAAFAAEAEAGRDFAFLMQALMLRGARIDIALPGEADVTLNAAGPMPQSVRAAYLNCAGDLYEQDR